eukprot:TRINITY_DN6295_c0_g1_i1.p1 TRINITY_DN6295_c0_g1~~TRINITY_DN6295_c0_g1_i1.p1  ORF type:complete len:392 (-),score=172.86 TRINITY_DN6295_c0_g1_i1:117-1292(-)
MGKGFNNYMCKKFFHPASADNLKRVWMATKKADAEKKKQDDLRSQYDKEQELYQNKALLSKESKERLEVNFMYEPPPGCKKIGEAEEGEGGDEYKFEWQRTWGNAPKESYLSIGDDFVEQPFGIQVCQAKCIKCGKYGHMNTDKRCHLYGKSVDHDAPIQSVDQDKLVDEMKADGLAMRWSAWDMNKLAGPNHQMVEDGEKVKPLVDRAEVLKSMSRDEKKKLLKKLKKMEKKKKKKPKKEKRRRSDGSSSDSSSDSEDERPGPSNKGRDDDRHRRERDDGRIKREDSRERRGNRDRSRSIDKRGRRSMSRDEKRDRARRGSSEDDRRARKRRDSSEDDRRARKRRDSSEDERKDRKRMEKRRSRSGDRRENRDRSRSYDRKKESNRKDRR